MPTKTEPLAVQDLRDVERRIDQLTFGAARAGRKGDAEPLPGPEPDAPPQAFRRIVVAVDGSEASLRAVRWGAEMARQARGSAKVWILTVVPSRVAFPPYAALAGVGVELLGAEEEAGRQALDEAAEHPAMTGLGPAKVLRTGAAAERIVALAREQGADLVVLGHHGRGPVERLLLGSVAEAVKDRAPCSVLLARNDPPPASVLVATDGSRLSLRAAGLGLRYARAWRARSTVLHAVQPPSLVPLDQARKAFELARGTLDLEAWREATVRYDLQFGPPAQCILAAAADPPADLVVLGSRGLGGLRGLAAGSVSGKVAREAGASVLLVKPPQERRRATA